MYNYIISTDDILAGNKKIDEIEKSLMTEVERITYNLEDDGVYAVIDELSTISLFDTTKLVICKQFELLSKASENAIRELITIMNDINSNNALVFITDKPLDLKDENIQKVKKYSTLIDIKLKNIPLSEVAKKELESDGYSIDGQALSLLVSYIDNLFSLQNYIDILKCYKCDNKIITAEDIKKLVASPLEDNVYNLVEAVLQKNKKHIMKSYKDLKLMNVQPSYLIGLLINKFQEIYNVSILLKSRMSQADLAEVFKVSTGRAFYMMKNAKNTTMQAIKNNLDALNKLELDIKSGKVEQNLGLELYLLR